MKVIIIIFNVAASFCKAYGNLFDPNRDTEDIEWHSRELAQVGMKKKSKKGKKQAKKKSVPPSDAPTMITPPLVGNPNACNCDKSKRPLADQDTSDADYIRNALDLYLSDREEAEQLYGSIECWNVERVTDMHALFTERWFNENLSCWNVSNARSMNEMFYNARNFNGDLSLWDVSQVTDMKKMFNGSAKFNRDVSAWNTSQVTIMEYMFYKAAEFNQNVSNWDVRKVLYMRGMFAFAKKFNQDLKFWDPMNVSDMDDMFYECESFTTHLCWDVSDKSTKQMLRWSSGCVLPQCCEGCQFDDFNVKRC